MSLVFVLTLPAFAQTPEEAASQNQQDRQTTKQELSEAKSKTQKNAQATKQAVCERRQKLIDNRVKGISNLVNKQFELLNTTYERIQAFVTKNNLLVENYQQLSGEVENAKSQATDKIESLKSNPPGLNCESEDHIANVQTYKTYVQTTNSALKSYRQSLRELIKSVKQAAKQSEDAE